MKKPNLIGNACGLAALGLGSAGLAQDAAPANPWTLEASLLYLEARADTYAPQEEEYGYRFGIAYQAQADSWGYRFRMMDHEGSNRGGKFTTVPEVTTYELEGFKSLSLGSWDGQWSLGLRYLELTQNRFFGSAVDYTGYGPVVGIDLTHDITDCYAVYFNGRASFLIGDDDDGNAADNTGVLEAGFGIQRSVSLGGVDGLVRVGLEGHRYFELDRNEDDADLFGGVLTLIVNF